MTDPSPPASPGRIAALNDGLHTLRLLIGLAVLLFISSLLGTITTAAPDTLYLHMVLWFCGQIAGIAVAIATLRWLRRRRFGALPCARVARPRDAILYIAASLGGALALLGFVPVIFAGAASGVDLAIAGLGLLLLCAGLRAAFLYVLRP